MRKAIVALLAVCGLLVGSGTALAYPPVETVHTEQVQAGPYRMTVGFSVWPLRAMQSLDFSFVPDGGIAGKSGTLALVTPDGGEYRPRPLARHPRAREVWGLDVFALDAEGTWTFRFTVDGPAGQGQGEIALPVLEQPGPPMALSWAISVIPLIGLVTFLVVAWRRAKGELTRA
ncbi:MULTISPECIES: hypothetical protein [Actinokineospora]|uniref:YtkA-like domain-containing protein n=1 Tax=Actinokineospora fastidiosa TaxID=1816 RepID=A0A918GEC2_9PSEU|nr:MULTISPECIES: hypothetical protein [Actinokineospora]UVS79757.1 hypothetical protein Actkin_03507 [Actinokineospora sp. UTMC 2448]GGS30767.1 hypothetical protein GCM10010171_25490 [Actinokineospora fastidiosa]